MAIHPGHSRPQCLTAEESTAVLTELAAILASSAFTGSKRCQDFLGFIIKRAIEGDYENLSERFLGAELFGRPIDYETSTDSIVRVRASDVRRRLGQYYAGLRSPVRVRIDLIAGGYIPEFHWQAKDVIDAFPSAGSTGASQTNAEVACEPQIPPGERSPARALLARVRPYPHAIWWGAAAVLLLAVCLGVLLHPHPTNFDRFWQPVLGVASAPLIVLPTSDTFAPIRASDALPTAFDQLRPYHNWHHSIPVVQATLSIALALQRKGKTAFVRVGTDLKMDEVRGHPVIAIGSFSNPWTKQNVAGLRFTFDRGPDDKDPPSIRDASNPSRSWTLLHVYPERQDKDYAIVTRTFDPVTHEPFLSLAGLHSFGNQIAAEFVARESSWDEVAARAPAGWEKMNLQLVLEANIIGLTPSSPRIVEAYFWK